MMLPPNDTRKISLDDEEILLDPKLLQFNDATILSGEFMQNISIWYDYYSSRSAKIEDLFVRYQNKYELMRNELFLKGKKEEGLSDKAADAFAFINSDLQQLSEKVDKYKYDLKQIKEYLKSLDKAHDMAKNRGYGIRKEMEKLSHDTGYGFTDNQSFEDKLDQIISRKS